MKLSGQYFCNFVEVPPLKANLLAVIVGKDSNLQIVEDFYQLPGILSSQEGDKGSQLGLVFDRTNFYSPCGGQASDIGVIRSAENQVGILDFML